MAATVSTRMRMPNLDRKSCGKGSHSRLLVSSGCSKRKAEVALDGEKEEKRRRLEPALKQRCLTILQKLITHPNGWVFSTPVDPIALNIPDYFSIISHPMDLSTIKSKLAGNRYVSTEEFASDVRLTFSNATKYNPPDNPVHIMAKELQCIFIKRWNAWKREMGNSWLAIGSGKSEKTSKDDLMALDKKSMWQVSNGLKACTTGKSYKNSLVLISNVTKKDTEDPGKGFSNISQGLISNGMEKNASQGLISDKTEKKAQCKISCSSSVLVTKRTMSVEEKQKLRKDLIEMLKGKMNGKLQAVLQKFGFIDSRKEKLDLDIEDLRDDILWELKRELKDCLNANSAKDSQDKILPARPKVQSKTVSTDSCSLDVDSSCQLNIESCGSCVDEEQTCPSSCLSTATTSGECWTPLIDNEQDLKKALRIAQLKSRFAETISKANGSKTDADQELERLKRLQREEEMFRARLREEQLNKEAELKRQRISREREAVRLSLQMMERTVDLEDNLIALKELEMLAQCSATYILDDCGPVMALRSFGTGEILSPSQKLGLYLKDDLLKGDDDEETVLICEAEEGEILG